MRFKDYFSGHAEDYARFRPSYPDELFLFLAALCESRELAWDCATGNGQTARSLSKQFRKVIATDASRSQIENASQCENVEYRVCPSEKTSIENDSVDLTTVSQAIHWFNFERFYQEVRRVSRKNHGAIAVWSYGLHTISAELDELSSRFYHKVVGPYWPKERRYVEEEYKTIPFPFKEIRAPIFEMREQWTLRELAGYLYTWSSTQLYLKQNKVNPLELIADDLQNLWGDPDSVRLVKWPIYMRAGIVE